MLNLYITRHGQTEWNIQRRFQGWLDSPLTEQGVQSAIELGHLIHNISFDEKYASSSLRASRTLALALGNASQDCILDDRIKEIQLGPWQGMTHESVEALYPEQIEAFYNAPEQFNLQGAETYFDVYQRVKAFLDELIQKYHQEIALGLNRDKNIFIVMHGISLMILQLIMDQRAVSEISQYSVSKNTQIHHYQFNEGQFTKVNVIN